MTLPTLSPGAAAAAPDSTPPELPQRPLLRRSVLRPRRPVFSRPALLLSLAAHLALVLLALFTLKIGRPGSGGRYVAPDAGGGESVEYMDITYYAGAGSGGAAGTAAAPAAPVAPPTTVPSSIPAPSATPAPVAAPRPVSPAAGVRAPAPAAPNGVPAPGARPGGAGGVPGAAPTPGAGAGGQGQGQGQGQGGLRPGFGDPRLITGAPKQVEERQKTQHERYMEHLEARIDAINDSLGIAADRERRSKDWTVKDKDGKRWGVSDKGIHLGPVTLPPVRLGGLPPIRGDATTEQGQRDQIRDQADRGARDDSRDESIRRTRERKDQERAAAKRDSVKP